MTDLTQISLFTGCGGIDLAFERAGFESLLQVEINKHARAVLERHWPDVERIEDVRNVSVRVASRTNRTDGPNPNTQPENSASASGPTVIHFGSPCQDLSIAGKRRGFAGERSGLYTEAIRIVREHRPAFAIWENVPGALSSNHGRDFGHAINLLAEAGALDIAWRVLDAQWFGVPQRRRRIFVVADFRGHRASEILFEQQGESGNIAPSREAGESIAASLRSRSSSPGVNLPGRGGEDDSNLVIADPLTVGANQYSGFTGEPVVAAFKGGAGVEASIGYREEQSPTLTGAASGSNGSPTIHTIAKPLLGKGNSSHADDLETYIPITAYALAAREAKGVSMLPAQTNYVARPGVRRLTPTECERLQGFPDGWTEFDSDGTPISDTQRFKMLGNSVAVPVLEWIANRMAAVQGYERA